MLNLSQWRSVKFASCCAWELDVADTGSIIIHRVKFYKKPAASDLTDVAGSYLLTCKRRLALFNKCLNAFFMVGRLLHGLLGIRFEFKNAPELFQTGGV